MKKALADALAERGYDTLTEVQKAVTEPDLAGADLLVSAQTGSGKTVGFGLAIADTLLGEREFLGRPEQPLALVIAPTRELAMQVQRELDWLYKKAGATVASCIGGMDARTERRALERGAHIVVGTPGRLRDHIERGALELASLRAVILDEADEMLDMGFREDLEFMLGESPEDRRTLLFSATVPPMIAKLAKEYQSDAIRVVAEGSKEQHADIEFKALSVAQGDVEKAIINLLRFHEARNAIVFANTRAAVNRLTARLGNRGFQVVSLSGELSQEERSHALQAMRDGRARVCVATDVAARGIDLPGLELVIHAELPNNTEALLHRSGRTGRAGKKGVSAFVLTPKIKGKADRLFKWAKITPEWGEAPTAEAVLERDEERLFADPIWSADPSEDEFAAKLLSEFGAEKITAAYLALYREKFTAPEELRAAGTDRKRERPSFGPSGWVSLNVGRDGRAEPRWLLPLLCSEGGLDKDDIGAIRIQQKETLVEIAEAALPGFMLDIGPDAKLEDRIKVRQLDEAPDLEKLQRPKRPGGPGGFGKPGGGRPGGKSFGGKPGGPRRSEGRDGDRFDDRPRRDPEAHKPARPKRDGDGYKKDGFKKDGFKKDGPRSSDGPSDRPKSKKVWGDAPSGKDGGARKGKFGDKPAGKPSAPKKNRFADPSFKPGGKGKPRKAGGKPGGKTGGFDTPRRKG